MTLRPGAAAEASLAERNYALVVPGVEVVGDQVHVPVSYDDGQAASMTFGTGGYHTYLDQEIANRLGKPAGDLDDVRFGATPDPSALSGISGMVALFPQPFDDPPEAVGRRVAAAFGPGSVVRLPSGDQSRQRLPRADAAEGHELLGR